MRITVALLAILITVTLAETGSDATDRIAFSSNRNGDYEIFVMNADGSNQTQLTFNDDWDSVPVWSPDGRFIVFSSDHDGDNEIIVMDADGENLTQLTSNKSDDYAPAWCPVE